MTTRSPSAWLNRAFAALADPVRRELIEILLEEPGLSIGEVCARFSSSRFTIMRHLNILEDAHLILRQRQGNMKHLFVDRESLETLSRGWLREVSSKKRKEPNAP